LGTLTGKNGEVKIPGFYDPVPELSPEEASLYDDITTALVQRNPELGDPAALATSLMRRWREASLTIHRFQTSGPDNATIIPRMAKAALSMRLVPNQEATQVAKELVSYVEEEFKKLESNNRLTVTIDHKAEPWLGDWTNEIFQTLEEAIMEAWGSSMHETHHRRKSSALPPRPVSSYTESDSSPSKNPKPSPTTSKTLANGSIEPLMSPMTPMTEVSNMLEVIASPTKDKVPRQRKPLYIREGGSIPAIRFLEKEFDAPAAHFPCGQASDSAHLDNERLRLTNLHKAKEVFKKVFRDLPMK
jgi:di- and tripeptidase